MTDGILSGKSIIITGASSGIGADAARVFAEEGARLVLSARTPGPLEALEAEVTAAGGEAVVVAGDISDPATARRLVATAVERFGRLNGALNNAGMTQFGGIADLSEADFDRIIAVNVKGVWLSMREQIRAMRASGGGAIVNVSSVGGYRGSPGLGAYQATKHAVIGMSRTAAHDSGPLGVRVNVVAPGATETPMLQHWRSHDPAGVQRRVDQIPLRRPATGGDVASAAAWLLSDRASYLNGVVVPVDGGYSA